MASTQICTAVSNPKVSSVAERSLSIVFGTPTTRRPFTGQPMGDAEGVLSPDRHQRVDPVLGEGGVDLRRAAVDLVGVRARRAEHRAAPRERASQLLDAERHEPPSSTPFHPSRNPTSSSPYTRSPLRATARITAFSPGQSPPPVSMATRMRSPPEIPVRTYRDRNTA